MTNPRDIVKKLLHGENCDDLIPTSYDDARWHVDSMSYATNDGVVCSKGIFPQTVFNIASISKTFTAATILRMVEDERFSALFFPLGIDAPISHFLEVLKRRYPKSDYIKTRLESENNFAEITIANLLNHSSGIGGFDDKDFAENLAFESPESLALEPDGKFFTLKRKDPKPEFGKYSYSNLGYELLGMIIAAAGSAALEKRVTCGGMIRDLVIDKLDLKQTFTQDQMVFDGEKVKVDTRPDIEVAEAYDSNNGKPHPSLVFRRAIATSGIYSTPQDVCKFAEAFFSDKTGLFEKLQTVIERDLRPIQIEPEKFYYAGYETYNESDGTLVKLHGAQTQGFFGWLGYRNDKAACCLVSCSNRGITSTKISSVAAESLTMPVITICGK